MSDSKLVTYDGVTMTRRQRNVLFAIMDEGDVPSVSDELGGAWEKEFPEMAKALLKYRDQRYKVNLTSGRRRYFVWS